MDTCSNITYPSCFPFVKPISDCEIDKIQIDDEKPTNHRIGSERFSKFWTWESRERRVKLRNIFVRNQIKHNEIDSVTAYELAELVVIQRLQREAYWEAFNRIECGQFLPNVHSQVDVSPFVDQHGVLLVGGRLGKRLDRGDDSHQPVIMPKNPYVTKLFVKGSTMNCYIGDVCWRKVQSVLVDSGSSVLRIWYGRR